MDPFDDIFSESAAVSAPAINKFQPKAKPRPRKAASKSGPTVCSDSKKKVVAQASSELHAGQDVQPVHDADKLTKSPIPSSALKDTSRTEKPLERDKDSSLGVPVMDSNNDSQPMNSLSQLALGEGYCLRISEKSVMKDRDVCSEFELESVDVFINPSNSGTAADNLHTIIGLNDHPESKPVNNDGKGGPLPPLKTQTFSVPGNTDTQRASHGHTSEDQASAIDCMVQDHIICLGATGSDQNRESDDKTQNSQTELSEIGFVDFETVNQKTGATALPGSRVGKYQPRPKVQNRKPVVSTEIFGTDTLSPPAAQLGNLGSLGSGQIDDGSGHADQPDGGSLPRDYSCDPGLNAELINSKETSPSQDPFSADVLPFPSALEKNTKSRNKSAKVSNHSQEPTESSLPGERNDGIKTRRRGKKSVATASPDFGPEERNCYGGVSHNENTANSIGTEDENRKDDDEFNGESTSKKKRAPRKGKKLDSSENSGQKRSRASKVPKKFPHATQRKRRCVDKNLLDTPEDEIDYRNLRIKDLIILAEVRERLASKVSRSDAPQTNQSFDDYEHDEFLANQNGLSPEQGGDFADEDTIRAQPCPSFFNYHSFMDRPRSTRWTKQETELFYEGVRQFGSDLSLIKQLFPDRDRNQVKQKYKQEERKNRSRLHETLGSRPKDYAHFKKVIEQLQQAAAQVEQDANGDHSMGKSDVDVEASIPEANVEAAKTKTDDDVGGEGDIPNVKSPMEAEGADDDDIWSNYQSIY